MFKRGIEQLAIYQTEKEIDTISLASLYSLYLNKTSEIIYFSQNDKLYGIVCLEDILYRSQNGNVRINKRYTVLTGFNVIKAHEIFECRKNIHKIPVVNIYGKLIGDYSRWDDMLYIERNCHFILQKDMLRKILQPYSAIYIVEPVENKKFTFLYLKEKFESFFIKYEVLRKNQIVNELSETALFVFIDEDEKKGTQCLYEIGLNQHKSSVDTGRKIQLITFKNLLNQILWNIQFEQLGIKKPDDLSYERIDDKTTILLSALENSNIKSFCISIDENKTTNYGNNFNREIRKRIIENPIDTNEPWPKRIENPEFFGELYKFSDYKNGIAQKEFYFASLAFEYKRNISGKYFSAKEGKRITLNQPEKYTGTIYLFGPCMIIGAFVEDQYTIASYLQNKLLKRGYLYRVENCGAMLRLDSEIDSRLQEISFFHKNDIVITVSRSGEAVGIQGCSLEKIFSKYNIPSEWVTNGYLHCNHKANELVADSMLEMIEPCLINDPGDNKKIQIDICEIMRGYVQCKYLNRYFSHFHSDKYSSIGAIVMNCNPFSKGHRYLIEQAKQQVDFLIIFAVEEDASLFPFEERFKLIVEGTKDLNNVMIVPSGDFVLSRNNFQEYFTKRENEVVAYNAAYDINVFADYIAKPLHITHRFAGEEPEDRVTKVYNETMSRILPKKGIVFVEIPRMRIDDEIVSASKIRKHLKDANYDKVFSLVPETTKLYLMNQI